MLTSEQIAQGWKEHDGGPCPVALDSKPWVMFRDGVVVHGTVSAAFWAGPSFNWWQHGSHGNDEIIAYREVPHD